jgi:acetyl-CoA carboxylase carboxyltransferase component
MSHKDHAAEDRLRRSAAQAMGGEAKLSSRAAAGELNARQRVDHLFDPGTFRETGLFATSMVPEDRASTPADGKITGTGLIGDRGAAVVAYDFTVKGASSSPVSNKKMQHMKDLAQRTGVPMVFLAESTGVRMPDIMGGAGMGGMNDKVRFLRRRESPWVSGVFGYSFGSAAWHTVASDFAVFRKGSVMAVSSPGLVSRATGQQVDKEELGGWKIHADVTGLVDAVAETDAEALEAIRTFLSYLPAHNQEAPPIVPVPPDAGANVGEVVDLVPESSSQVYDVRKVIACLADPDSVFELKSRYAKNMVTALTRFEGRTVGVIANNPMFKAGAIDADACDKSTSFLVLCDSYNIPVVFLVDQPGFLVGLEAERQKIAGKVINWMNALSLVTVPKVTVMTRKNYGQAFVNMGGAETADASAAWWTAEVSFMDPRSAVGIVHGITPDDNPDEYRARFQEMARDTTGYDIARVYGVHEVIDPLDTRQYIVDALKANYLHRTNGVGEHLLSNWPTSY